MARKKGLKLEPIHPQGKQSVWYYEEKSGISVYVAQPGLTGVISFKISYRSLEAYLRRRNEG